MRSEDVEVGGTYTAAIPQRLPEELRRRPFESAGQWQADIQLHLARGRRIRVVVTGFGESPGNVQVNQELPTGRVRLRLAGEQAADLGLAVDQVYGITGIVTDHSGEAITFPGVVSHTIPARWLRPPSERLELAPETERLHRALVCRDADGLDSAAVRRAAAKALENLRRLQGLALEDPDVDWGVLTAELDHREWLRIAALVISAGLDVYDPRSDPDAVEYPPVVRFGKQH